jgi:hypothetical protein
MDNDHGIEMGYDSEDQDDVDCSEDNIKAGSISDWSMTIWDSDSNDDSFSPSDDEDDSSSDSTDSDPGVSRPVLFIDGYIDTAQTIDKGRLCTVAMTAIDDDTAQARQLVEECLNQRNHAARVAGNEGLVLQSRSWQVASAAEIILGRDTMVITATGSGKTMCFLLPLFSVEGIIIVISPFLAFMEDQVRLSMFRLNDLWKF